MVIPGHAPGGTSGKKLGLSDRHVPAQIKQGDILPSHCISPVVDS